MNKARVSDLESEVRIETSLHGEKGKSPIFRAYAECISCLRKMSFVPMKSCYKGIVRKNKAFVSITKAFIHRNKSFILRLRRIETDFAPHIVYVCVGSRLQSVIRSFVGTVAEVW